MYQIERCQNGIWTALPISFTTWEDAEYFARNMTGWSIRIIARVVCYHCGN